LGLISYVVKVAAGKRREIELLVWILTVLIHLRYVHLVAAKDICRPEPTPCSPPQSRYVCRCD
jgi:hypothetical protein